MTDALDHPDPRAPKELASARERARGEIRAELARQRPIEDARVALELIAESALRFPVDAGPLGYRVVDENGAPRVATRDGVVADFTIRDLVADLRQKHPTLFKPMASDAANEPEAAAPSAPAQPPSRDWLMVKETVPAAAEPAPPSAPGETVQPTASTSPEWIDMARQHAGSVTAVMSGAFRRASLRGKAMLQRARTARARARQEGARGDAVAAASAPQGRRRLPMGYAVAAAAAAIVLIVVGFVLGTAVRPGGPKRDSERAAVASNAPAPAAPVPQAAPATPAPQARPATPAPPPEVRTVTPAPPPSTAPATPPSPPAPPAPAPEPAATASVAPAAPARGVLAGVPEVIDTATLRIEGKVVRLFGVEWARGAQGDDLKGYIRGRSVRCTATGTGDVHRCEVDGKDLSEVVLYNGGGRATPDAPTDLVAAENHAKAEKLGVWKK